jgi:hypothetical protein
MVIELVLRVVSMKGKRYFYKKAAKRIASQKVALVKIVAAQRHAQDSGIRRRALDIALLRSILKISETHFTQLALAKNNTLKEIIDGLDEQLDRFDELADSGRLKLSH